MNAVLKKTEAQIRKEAHEAARASLLADIDLRHQETTVSLEQLRRDHHRKLEEVRKAAEFFDYNITMVRQSEAGQIYQNIRTAQHLTLPDLTREREAVVGGYHPKLAGFTHNAVMNLAENTRKAYEEALAEFRLALSPKVIAAAKLVVTTHTAMLITPPAVAIAIADSNF